MSDDEFADAMFRVGYVRGLEAEVERLKAALQNRVNTADWAMGEIRRLRAQIRQLTARDYHDTPPGI